MQESITKKDDTLLDITGDSDEECQVIGFVQKDLGPVFDLTADEDEERIEYQEELANSKEEPTSSPCKKMSPKEENNGKIEQGSISESPEKGESSGTTPSKNFRNFDKCLEKAVAEIKKGGSLNAVAAYYGISQDILYNKLISRRLPNEVEVLTKFEENNLVKWILKSNEKNSLVLKNHLLERVGKIKKISKITPIFSKSKFGKMWYTYFLKSHPEIYDNDGLLMPSDLIKSYSNNSPVKSSPGKDNVQQTIKRETTKVKKDLAELWFSFGIKEAKVVLHDFRKLKKSPLDLDQKENMPLKFKTESVNDENKSDPEKCAVKSEQQTRTHKSTAIQNGTGSDFGKDVSSVLNVNVKKEEEEEKEEEEHQQKPGKLSELRMQCDKCKKTFCNRSKLLRHLVLHKPKELYTIACYKCTKKFPSKYHFKLHLKLSHSTNYYGCDECGKVFKHQTSLSKHKRKIHLSIKHEAQNFICDMCGKSFNYKNSLEAHIIYGHLKEDKKYKCDVCKKNFIKYSAMVRHSFRHSKIKPFSCLYCHKTFSRKYLLREHIDACSKNKETKIDIDYKKISKEYLEGISLD